MPLHPDRAVTVRFPGLPHRRRRASRIATTTTSARASTSYRVTSTAGLSMNSRFKNQRYRDRVVKATGLYWRCTLRWTLSTGHVQVLISVPKIVWCKPIISFITFDIYMTSRQSQSESIWLFIHHHAYLKIIVLRQYFTVQFNWYVYVIAFHYNLIISCIPFN